MSEDLVRLVHHLLLLLFLFRSFLPSTTAAISAGWTSMMRSSGEEAAELKWGRKGGFACRRESREGLERWDFFPPFRLFLVLFSTSMTDWWQRKRPASLAWTWLEAFRGVPARPTVAGEPCRSGGVMLRHRTPFWEWLSANSKGRVSICAAPAVMCLCCVVWCGVVSCCAAFCVSTAAPMWAWRRERSYHRVRKSLWSSVQRSCCVSPLTHVRGPITTVDSSSDVNPWIDSIGSWIHSCFTQFPIESCSKSFYLFTIFTSSLLYSNQPLFTTTTTTPTTATYICLFVLFKVN